MQLNALFNRLLAANQVDSIDWFDLVAMQCQVEAACLDAMRHGVSEPACGLSVRQLLGCVGRLLAAVEPADVLTVQQAAERLGVSIDSVYDLCKGQRLKHKRIGRAIRIHPADLDSFVADSTKAAPSRVLKHLR